MRMELSDMPIAAAQGGTQPSAAAGIAAEVVPRGPGEILTQHAGGAMRMLEREGQLRERASDVDHIGAGERERGASRHGNGHARRRPGRARR